MKIGDYVRGVGHTIGIVEDIHKYPKETLVLVKHKPDISANGPLVHNEERLQVIARETFELELEWFEELIKDAHSPKLKIIEKKLEK